MVKKKYKKVYKKKVGIKTTIRKMISRTQELKRFDGILAETSITTTPTISDLFFPTQGDTDTERIGDQLILTKNCEFNLTVRWNTLNLLDGSSFFRIIIFQWHPNTVPISSDLLINVGGVGTVRSLYNLDTRQQYDIIYDRIASVNTWDNDRPWIGPRRIFSNKINKRVQFVNGTTAGTNKIYMYLVSDLANAATHESPLVQYSTRIYFKDS